MPQPTVQIFWTRRLLRPGRFDRQIVVDRPDIKGRTEILKVHVKGKPMGPDVNLDVIAQRTPGFTGADLSNLVNEAALLTARKDKKLSICRKWKRLPSVLSWDRSARAVSSAIRKNA